MQKFSFLIPASLLTASGKVFYSGRTAFGSTSKLYILGLNPGGSPEEEASETVGGHTEKVLTGPADWSAYRDEGWRGLAPGADKMQHRVLHLLCRLNFEPGQTPASIVVFARSPRGADIKSRFVRLAPLCWPFHQRVIEQLGVRVVLCLGNDAGDWVCNQLKARLHVGEFVESNERRWRSTAFINSNGIAIVIATHPSIADWTKSATDPTPLLQRMLARD